MPKFLIFKAEMRSVLIISMISFCCTYLVARAEEESILKGATLGNYDVDSEQTWNSLALIDGNFKSLITSTWD